MATQIAAALAGTLNHGQCIPTHQRADATLHKQVAGHAGFFGRRNRVAIRRRYRVRQLSTLAAGSASQTGQQVVNPLFAFIFQYGFKCIKPFLSLNRIGIALHCVSPVLNEISIDRGSV